jgi:formylglycine-generating enzyme required for sulfatase activity
MGSSDYLDGDLNLPLHVVDVPAFEITRTEITVAAYDACIEAGICRPQFSQTDDNRCNWSATEPQDRPQSPIDCLSWKRSREFCTWVGGRLPSEAEWEYAARGQGQMVTYPWGNASPTCALTACQAAGCQAAIMDPVCSHPSGNTAQGICDMAGNAWEWVEDVFVNGYDGAPTDGSARETGGIAGSGGEPDRVERGGGFDDQATQGLRNEFRGHYSGNDGDAGLTLGFRCARSSCSY